MKHPHRLGEGLRETLCEENFISDRSDGTDDRVHPDVIRLMQFGISSYNHGTAEEVILPSAAATEEDDDDMDTPEEHTRTSMLFQPDLIPAISTPDASIDSTTPAHTVPTSSSSADTNQEQQTSDFIPGNPTPDESTAHTDPTSSSSAATEQGQPTSIAATLAQLPLPAEPPTAPPNPITDVIAFNSTTLSNVRGLESLVFAFPTIFPFGCGGFQEQRLVRMTDNQWVLRLLRLHGEPDCRISQHYGLLPTAFDILAQKKSFTSQFVSIRVKDEAITNFGMWRRSDMADCVKYVEESQAKEQRGQKPDPPPEHITGLLGNNYLFIFINLRCNNTNLHHVILISIGMISLIKPGMSAMYGSDAERASARNVGFGYAIRMGNPNIFLTHSPDPYGNYILSVNTSNMDDPSHVDFKLAPNAVNPKRKMRKKFANTDPVQCALYAKAVNDAFIAYFLGWCMEKKGPKAEGGVFGLVRWFHQSAETQNDGTLHFHMIASIYGLPNTSEAMTEALQSEEFRAKFTAYIDAITPPEPFLADCTGRVNGCPVANCQGTLKPVPIPGEAFCQQKQGQTACCTAHCPECETDFKHKEVITRAIHAFAIARNIDTSKTAVDRYRCMPPELRDSDELSDEDLVYLGLNLLDFQFHHATHTKSCFKVTARTPSGCICRYLFPKLARLEQTCIDINTGRIESRRRIGLEYYNLCSLLWTRLSKNNMDIQFLINSGSRRATSYTIKYTCKSQKPLSSLTMKLGLLSTASIRTLSSLRDEDVTPNERGRRFMYKALFQFTKPEELHLTMAAFMLINGGPFIRSHNVHYLNLRHLAACFPDVQEPQTHFSHADYADTDDEAAVDDYHDHYADVEVQTLSDEDETVPPTNESSESAGYVDVNIPQSSLLNNSNDEENDNHFEADEFVDLCIVTDYINRPDCMKHLNFAETNQQYHIQRKAPPQNSRMAMQPTHPKAGKLYWKMNDQREEKCIIFCGGPGCQFPNLLKANVTAEEKEFFFKSLLLLFKPFDYSVKSVQFPYSSYQEAYRAFLETDSDHARQAKLQEALLRNYHLDDICTTGPQELPKDLNGHYPMGHYAVTEPNEWRKTKEHVTKVIRYYGPGPAYNDYDIVHPLSLPEPAKQPQTSIDEHGPWYTWNRTIIPITPAVQPEVSPLLPELPPMTLNEVMELAVQRALAKRKLLGDAPPAEPSSSETSPITSLPGTTSSSTKKLKK